MTLRDWLDKKFEGVRGGASWLMRESGTSFPTVRKALNGVPIERDAAVKIAAATGGRISAESLVLGAAPSKRAAKGARRVVANAR